MVAIEIKIYADNEAMAKYNDFIIESLGVRTLEEADLILKNELSEEEYDIIKLIVLENMPVAWIGRGLGFSLTKVIRSRFHKILRKIGRIRQKAAAQITATYTCYPYFIYFSIFLLLLLPLIENPVKSMLPLGNNISNNKETSSILLLKRYLQFQLFRYFHKTIAIRFVGYFLRRANTHPNSLLAIIFEMHCLIAHNPVGHRIVNNIANLL